MGADPRLMELPVPILQERIASGAMRAADLAAAAAAKVEAADGDGLAWFDGDYLRRQGAGMDVWRGRGRPLGALHGLPVTVGDLADTVRKMIAEMVEAAFFAVEHQNLETEPPGQEIGRLDVVDTGGRGQGDGMADRTRDEGLRGRHHPNQALGR